VPGVGFDVTPTDCIALMLKMALPEAHELALGFEADQRMSPGTAKTAIEALGKSGKIRRSGRIVDLPIGRGCREIDFGRGPKLAMPIPWGDVATAFYTTGIPQHHGLHANFFVALGACEIDECVWLHPTVASRQNLAH